MSDLILREKEGEMVTMLHIAAENARPEIARFLIKECGADVNAKILPAPSEEEDEEYIGHWTPLHCAVSNIRLTFGRKERICTKERMELIETLIKNDADVNFAVVIAAPDEGPDEGLEVDSPFHSLFDGPRVVTPSPFHLLLDKMRHRDKEWIEFGYLRLFLSSGAIIDEKGIKKAYGDPSEVLLCIISKAIHLLRKRERVPRIVYDLLLTDTDKAFLKNLALSIEKRLPVCSFKLFLKIRDFISLRGLFMAYGYARIKSLTQFFLDNTYRLRDKNMMRKAADRRDFKAEFQNFLEPDEREIVDPTIDLLCRA